jgi:hypothetical protein
MSRYMQPGEHGSPADRGAADSYYRRSREPHKYPDGTYCGERVTDLTQGEIDSYNKAFDENEADGNFKEY